MKLAILTGALLSLSTAHAQTDLLKAEKSAHSSAVSLSQKMDFRTLQSADSKATSNAASKVTSKATMDIGDKSLSEATFTKTLPKPAKSKVDSGVGESSLMTSGNEGGGGGSTYYSQLKESFVIAAAIMSKTESLVGVSDDLNQVYQKHKDSWVKRLESNPEVKESKQALVIDGEEKAAVAYSGEKQIKINLPYWEKRPISMVQSVVLAIHETGHLEDIRLSHHEFDQIGFALARQEKSLFGSVGLRKMSVYSQSLSPREKVKLLFDDSTTAATLNDFGNTPSDKEECIVYPPKQEVIYSHPAWFYKKELELAPDSPLFPGGQKQTIIYSSFYEGRSTYSDLPTHHKMEHTPRSLIVNFWGSIKSKGDRSDFWDMLRYEFRKNGDLMAFKLTFKDAKVDSYGYCWKKK